MSRDMVEYLPQTPPRNRSSTHQHWVYHPDLGLTTYFDHCRALKPAAIHVATNPYQDKDTSEYDVMLLVVRDVKRFLREEASILGKIEEVSRGGAVSLTIPDYNLTIIVYDANSNGISASTYQTRVKEGFYFPICVLDWGEERIQRIIKSKILHTMKKDKVKIGARSLALITYNSCWKHEELCEFVAKTCKHDLYHDLVNVTRAHALVDKKDHSKIYAVLLDNRRYYKTMAQVTVYLSDLNTVVVGGRTRLEKHLGVDKDGAWMRVCTKIDSGFLIYSEPVRWYVLDTEDVEKPNKYYPDVIPPLPLRGLPPKEVVDLRKYKKYPVYEYWLLNRLVRIQFKGFIPPIKFGTGQAMKNLPKRDTSLI